MTDLASLPEILAPAGAAACLPAAVAGGAGAVYLGLRHFNARGRADNFKRAELAGHVAYCHSHGVKVYVVLNTLVHDDELPKALDLAYAAYAAGVDAAIIQDWGLWRAIGTHVPGLPRHASTQMTVYRPEQVVHLGRHGAERVILARELSFDEIAACVRAGEQCGVEIEVFVHGALCYAVSGQCLISNFSGCRSANRGTCAQNCRFIYDDGEKNDTALSMRDFNLLSHVGELARIGVASLKIEGRLKGPDYVYTVSRAYRDALAAWQSGESVSAATRDAVHDVFSRGFTDDPLQGRYGESSRLQRDGNDAAPIAGELLRLDRRQGTADLRTAVPPQAGDGFRFRLPLENGEFFDDGFLIQSVGKRSAVDGSQATTSVRIRVQRRGPPLRDSVPVIRNRRAATEKDLQAALAALPPWRGHGGVLVEAVFSGGLHQSLQMTLRSRDGRSVTVASGQSLTAAEQRGLSEAALRKAVGTLAETRLVLDQVLIDDALCEELPNLFMPAGAIKSLRRDAVAALLEVAVPEFQWPVPLPELGLRQRTTRLFVVVADLSVAAAVWEVDPQAAVIVEDMPHVAAAVAGTWYVRGNPFVAPPTSLPPGMGYCAADVASAAHWSAQGVAVISDPACNVFNTQTMQTLWDAGASAVSMSFECSSREVARVMSRLFHHEHGQVIVPIHGRLPAMLTRQDHGLATGETRQLQASAAEGGIAYRLQRREDGTTMLWEERRMAAPTEAAALRGVVDGWWLELGDLSPADAARVVRTYRDLRDGTIQPDAVLTDLQDLAGAGFFPGHLRKGSRELDRLKQQVPDAKALNQLAE